MAVTEEAVDVGRADLARRHRADDGGRAGDGVAARKHVGRAGHIAGQIGLERAAARLDAFLFKVVRFDALADGDDEIIAGDAELALGRVARGRAAVAAVAADDLGFGPQRGDIAVLPCLDAVGACSGRIWQPSACASAISSGRAVMSSMRRR